MIAGDGRRRAGSTRPGRQGPNSPTVAVPAIQLRLEAQAGPV